jgi:nucleoid-associated protein YgaU
MKDSMNTAATITHQEIGKNIENEIDSKHSGISSNSNDKFSIDTSSSGGSSDVENVLKNNSVVVRKGDTLNKIIIRIYGKEELEILDAILRVNPEISNPNIIFENQIIKLPEKFNRG